MLEMGLDHIQRKRLLGLKNVGGVGRGYKEVKGKQQEQPSVTIMVSRKLPLEQLPPGQAIPLDVGGVITDVIEVGEIQLLNRTGRFRPALPGVSIGHYRVTAGTFGALVKDARTGEPLILSNNHVLANTTDGSDCRARRGDPVLQPGRYDGGTREDVIGYLERFVPIYREFTFSRCRVTSMVEKAIDWGLGLVKPGYGFRIYRRARKPNLVDAAVARPVSPDVVAGDILELGRVTGVANPAPGMKVQKSGRTTGLTTGTIRVVDATVRVFLGDGFAWFDQQVVTTPMAAPGDSGSLVVTENLQAAGLLAAGSEQATIFGTFKNVMDLLRVTL